MTEEENVKLVRDHFAAFGKGNLDGTLKVVAEEVDWQSPATRSEHAMITWGRRCHSREEVGHFFRELGDVVQPGELEILGIVAQDDKVVVEGCNRGRVRSTGLTYEHDWVMVFTIEDGKIVRLRHYYDTADVISAFR